MTRRVKEKRLRRCAKREHALGPERAVVEIIGEEEQLACGHRLRAVPGGLTHPKLGGVVRRRCPSCKASEETT
jgi:hypothetical protein